jgi:hypothetical protein
MREFSIFIVGDPAPQGSKRHVGNGVMIEASKKVKRGSHITTLRPTN